MDCKRALSEADGDEAAAIEALNRKAKGKLETRSARETGQGRIGLFIRDDAGTAGIVELRCETAQVAQNEAFVDLANNIAAAVSAGGDANPDPVKVLTLAAPGQDGKTLADLVSESFAKLQENTKLIRCRKITGSHVAGYLHFDGTTGVVVALDAKPNNDRVAVDLCQHAAFTKPIAITSEQIAPERIEQVRSQAKLMAEEEGKPPQIVEKIVEGKVNAYCKENALIEQEHVKPDYEKKTVKASLADAGVGAVTDLVVFQVGGE
jgi:elongation factor Ts